MEFDCLGLEEKCSLKCCSPKNLEVSLQDLHNLFPHELSWSDLDFYVNWRFLDKEWAGFYKMSFLINLDGEPCEFLRESGRRGYACTLNNNGFGLDVCKLWPVREELSNEGPVPVLASEQDCPGLEEVTGDEVIKILYEKNQPNLRRREFYNQDFSRFLSGKRLDWPELSHYLLEWVERGGASKGSGVFSLMHEGHWYPRVSFRSWPRVLKSLK